MRGSFTRALVAVAAVASVAIAVATADPAFAQGRGRGHKSGGQGGNPGGNGEPASAGYVTVDPVTSSPATPQSRAAYFGSWLDDASVVGPGAVWAAVSFVAAQGDQFNFPVADMAIGATPRTHIGVSVPVARIDDGSGAKGASIQQAFFYGKWRLRDASVADDRLGIAVTPVLEMSRSDVDGSQQVSVGAPVNLEVRHGPVRAYGSVGFFTRGAFFQSAALEVMATPRLAITGTVGHTYSAAEPEFDVPGLHRTDVGVGASVTLNRTLAVFGAVGRSRVEDIGATWVAAGLSVFSSR